MTIHYIKGDATRPIGAGRKTIAHIVNDVGRWGAGFTRALTERWPETEVKYYRWFEGKLGFPELGSTYAYSLKHIGPNVTENDLCPLDDPEALYLFNMCAQHGVGRANKPIRYEALDKCLKDLGAFSRETKTTVHGPRFGSGLAAGDWNKIEKLINKNLIGIKVFIYDL
jgi:hypothetical protein